MTEQRTPTRPRSPTVGSTAKSKPKPWYASLGSNTAAAVVIFVVTPLILVSIGAPMVVPEYRVLTFRSFLVLTLCLLPATMWYLFIIPRRACIQRQPAPSSQAIRTPSGRFQRWRTVGTRDPDPALRSC